MNVATLGAQWVLGMSGRQSKSLQVKLDNEPCRDCDKQIIATSNCAVSGQFGSKANSV